MCYCTVLVLYCMYCTSVQYTNEIYKSLKGYYSSASFVGVFRHGHCSLYKSKYIVAFYQYMRVDNIDTTFSN